VEEFVGQLSGGKPFAEFEAEFFKTIRPSSLLKRFATTEEVANLVIYVCSPCPPRPTVPPSGWMAEWFKRASDDDRNV
jgi:hypothetical protein